MNENETIENSINQQNKQALRPLSCRVAVIGAGHAGIEAALASARMGLDTVLFTMSLESVGNMPCNPCIGGTAKGHLVFEIDALGGEMGRAADICTMQSRTLNLGKGAAVHSKRVQADRKKYQAYMKHVLETTPNLRLVQSEIVAVETETVSENGAERQYVRAVKTKLNERWSCDAAIVATGTYLESSIFVGDVVYGAGPDGFLPSSGLSASLASLGLKLVRFKTGTPARVNKRSIDFTELEEQPGEETIIPFCADHSPAMFDGLQQSPCHIVYTNDETHRIIKENIKRSAMYSGHIRGTGPRYCPSIEDKIVRFADKERHQLFVEPLGENTEEMYIQGFSTSLPTDVQLEMYATLKGFQNCEIMRYAYAIEYDCADPTQMDATLGFKAVGGLYGAGQFNGTSGYEEAAAQGLIAGINAALWLKGEEPLILQRSDGYIGTLVDDLVTKGTNEPYRMMTSRSEYRLLLRQDNADLRLTPMGHRVGLVTTERYDRFLAKKARQEAEIERLEHAHVSLADANSVLEKAGEKPVVSGVTLADLLRRPPVSYADLSAIDPERPALSPQEKLTVEVSVKYEGYIKKELAEVARHKKLEDKQLSPDIDYNTIAGLRLEAAQKLNKVKPLSVGQAARISGVSPADVSVLLIWLGLK